PPMTAAAIMAAIGIVRTEIERCARLFRLVTFFDELLRFNDIAIRNSELETQIVPIHIGTIWVSNSEFLIAMSLKRSSSSKKVTRRNSRAHRSISVRTMPIAAIIAAAVMGG